jgi:DNA-binding NtrC family response regulator/tetratricopeptide (TPR) repeat protein
VAGQRPNIEPERNARETRRRPDASRPARERALSAIQLGHVYLESDSYSDAIGCFNEAERDELRTELTGAEVAGLLASIARCHLGLGDHGQARRYIQDVEGLDLDDDDASAKAEAYVVLSRVETKGGRFGEALEAARAAYDLLRGGEESELLAEASKAMGTAHAELGDSGAARDCFIECLVTNRRLGNDAGVSGAYNNLGILAKRSGDLASAIDYFRRALEIDERLGRPASIARRLNNLGIALFRMSRWTEAEQHLIRALEIYSGLGAARDVVSVESALGNICRVRREWGRARSLFESVLEKSREAGYRRAEALALEFLGELSFDRGEYDAALDLLDQALACAYRLSSSSDVVAEVLRRRAEVLLGLGRLDEAERDGTRALALCRKLGDRLEGGATLRVLAEVSYERGDADEARVLVRRAEDTLRRTGESFELAKAAFSDGVGLARALHGVPLPLDTIEARIATAEELFLRIGAAHWAARCRLERAKALRRAGRASRARSWLEQARPEFEKAGDRAGLIELDALHRELDSELAAATATASSRYSIIAEAYRLLQTSGADVSSLHSLAARVAEALSADRLLLLTLLGNGRVRVSTSVDRTGRRLAEVRRLVRSVIEGRASLAPVVAGAGTSEGVVPPGIAGLALVPAESVGEGDARSLLYVDRLAGDGVPAFSTADVEFIAAASSMLDLVSAGVAAAATDHADRDEEDDGHDLVKDDFVTRDPRMLSILANVARLRESTIPVLILGESGVGKDIVARMIHDGGRSGTGRFVALNSGAVVPNLQESELFGHARGAFTDAVRDREGLVGVAERGTLFLDEIGEMSLELQVKLLRFLQSGEYRRVGESTLRTSDARIISASNRDLRGEVAAERFRRDLFYRLSGFVIEVPPLRERSHDIPLLMEHFLELYSRLEGKRVAGFSREVRELFLRHDWRGNNVRELENEVRRGVALCDDGGTIGLDEIRPELAARREEILGRSGRLGTHPLSLREEVEALERNRIREALETTGHSKRGAAKRLGLSRTGLYTKLRKYGME